MSLLSYIQKEAKIPNTKGGFYYSTTYNANLDFFAGVSRNQDEEEVLNKFKKALAENESLALANLLLLLDIRGGKGERRLFKICYKYLCNYHKGLALKILSLIPELGRWDYALEGIGTGISQETLEMIRGQFFHDLDSPTPSLLAKWLPSHRSHGKDNPLAKEIYTYFNISEKQYRKLLKKLRQKLKLVENNLTNRDYNIDFEKVPTKAMLKYRKAFEKNCNDSYSSYLEAVANGEKSINTKGLYCYEIIQKILNGNVKTKNEFALLDNMWDYQKDFLADNTSNVLVMADTSGSMTNNKNMPLANSIGLAIYIAERNYGFFHNYFITFSEYPVLQKIEGSNIVDKVNNIESIVANTDIDKAFQLLLQAAESEGLSQQEMPSHILIISDMEFDQGCYCSGDNLSDSVYYDQDLGWVYRDRSERVNISGWNFDWRNNRPAETNLEGWKRAFNKAGYTLPKIIFWNVATETHGLPATKRDNDVAMVSGFSPYILENILNPERISPEDIMLDTLGKYVHLLEKIRLIEE